MLTVGALAWSSMIIVFGLNSDTTAYQYAHNASSFLFQVGVLSLVRVLWRSRAIGDGRVARTVLRIETGALLLAMASTASDFFGLTTVAQFPSGQGEKAVDILMDLLHPATREQNVENIPLPYELIVRSSTTTPTA